VKIEDGEGKSIAEKNELPKQVEAVKAREAWKSGRQMHKGGRRSEMQPTTTLEICISRSRNVTRK